MATVKVREEVRCISRDILHKQFGFTGAGPSLLALQVNLLSLKIICLTVPLRIGMTYVIITYYVHGLSCVYNPNREIYYAKKYGRGGGWPPGKIFDLENKNKEKGGK